MLVKRLYGTACYIDGITLIETGTTNLKVDPTIVNGDVEYSIDGADFIEYTIGVGTSIVTPPGSVAVRLSPNVSMMTGKTIIFKFVDLTTPKEWDDYIVIVETYGNPAAQYPDRLVDLIDSPNSLAIAAITSALPKAGRII